jgi:hypothetical protein
MEEYIKLLKICGLMPINKVDRILRVPAIIINGVICKQIQQMVRFRYSDL